MRELTVRTQKIKKDTVKARLFLFGALVVLLLLASAFSARLTPYDPYLQDLATRRPPRLRSISSGRTATAGTCSHG